MVEERVLAKQRVNKLHTKIVGKLQAIRFKYDQTLCLSNCVDHTMMSSKFHLLTPTSTEVVPDQHMGASMCRATRLLVNPCLGLYPTVILHIISLLRHQLDLKWFLPNLSTLKFPALLTMMIENLWHWATSPLSSANFRIWLPYVVSLYPQNPITLISNHTCR